MVKALKRVPPLGGEGCPVVAFAKGGNSDEMGNDFPISLKIIPKYPYISDCQRSRVGGDVAPSHID